MDHSEAVTHLPKYVLIIFDSFCIKTVFKFQFYQHIKYLSLEI